MAEMIANAPKRPLERRKRLLPGLMLSVWLVMVPACINEGGAASNMRKPNESPRPAATNEAPDGRAILTNGAELISHCWSTNERHTLVKFPFKPDSVGLLPNRNQCVVVKGTEVALIDLMNGHETILGEYEKAGQPRASADGSQCAWVATLKSGKSALVICHLASRATETWPNKTLAITDVGPNWIEEASGMPRFLVSTTNGRVGVLSEAGKKFVDVCAGEVPLLLPSGDGFVYFHEDALWKGQLNRTEKKRVCRLPKTVWNEKSCCVSPNGRFVLFKRIRLMRIAVILGQPFYTADLINIDSGKRREIEVLGDCRGAWAWDHFPCDDNGT